MSRFRKELLFLCDSLILFAVATVLIRFSVRYTQGGLVRGALLTHLLLLYACTVVFQIAFHMTASGAMLRAGNICPF